MMKKILTLLSVIVVLIGGIGVAHAVPSYFTALSAACPTAVCTTCHTSTGGPPPFTAYGTSFSGISTHSSNPSGAIATLGCPGGTPTCTSFTYSAWGACQSNGTQTRTVTASSPTGCTGGTPVTSQACTYVPPACTYTYSAWGACQSNGTQTRTVTSTSPSGCTGTPVTSQACTYTAPTCTSFTYNAWGACTNGTQTRTVATSSPSGCTGGTPVISQSCTNTQPCTSYTYTWGACQPNGSQTATSTTGVPAGCSGGVTPVTTQSCTYTAPTCTSFTYSAWGACQSNGTQTRTVTAGSPAGCTGGSPVTSQACTYTPPPPAGGTMSLPTSRKTFTYDPVSAPILSTDPAQARPIGVGAIANGGNTFDITIALDKFSGPADVSFSVYASSIDPHNVYSLDSGYSLRRQGEDDGEGSGRSGGRVIWKTRVQDVTDALLLNVPVSALPSGAYTLTLGVTPSNNGDDDDRVNGYYRWITTFSIK